MGEGRREGKRDERRERERWRVGRKKGRREGEKERRHPPTHAPTPPLHLTRFTLHDHIRQVLDKHPLARILLQIALAPTRCLARAQQIPDLLVVELEIRAADDELDVFGGFDGLEDVDEGVGDHTHHFRVRHRGPCEKKKEE